VLVRSGLLVAREALLAITSLADDEQSRGLTLAQFDVNRGALGHDHRVRIKEAVDGLIDNLADHDPGSVQKEGDSGGAVIPIFTPEELAPPWRGTAVLCVAGRGSLDEASAAMLAQLLPKHGIGARVVPSEAAMSPIRARSRRPMTVEVSMLSSSARASTGSTTAFARRSRRAGGRAPSQPD
jgi:hypothetical protein